jgi:hypothetical protein
MLENINSGTISLAARSILALEYLHNGTAMAFKQLSLLLAPILLLADLSAAAECSRAELSAAADGYFKAGFGKSAYATAPNVKITENGFAVTGGLASTSFSTITKFDRPYKVQAIDTIQCQIASLVVLTETTTGSSATAPAIYSLRLKLAGPGGKPSEIEILDISKNSNARDLTKFGLKTNSNYRVDHFPQTQEAYWTQPLTDKISRDQLVNITMEYDDEVEIGPDQDPDNPDFLLYNRRFVVDTVTGVVENTYFLDAGESVDAFTHEYFKIGTGAVYNETGTFVPVLWGTPDAWPGGLDPPQAQASGAPAAAPPTKPTRRFRLRPRRRL